MSESGSGEGSSRRNFLKGFGKVSVGVAAAGVAGGLVAEAKREIPVSHEGLKTDVGTFFPLYENHKQGITAESIPNNLDVFFREVHGKDYFSPSAEDLLHMVLNRRSKHGTTAMTAEGIAKLAQSGTELMLGDVDTNEGIAPNVLKGKVAIEAGLGFLVASKDQHVSRRRLLKAGSALAAAWVASPASAALMLNTEKKIAFDRVMTRINGLTSNAHPEDATIFLRNIVMADKMLEVAKLQKIEGKDPRIAYNVGRAHSGIEDFLLLGQDACRGILSTVYSDAFLKKTVEENYGAQKFASARLLKLPTDFKPSDVEETISADWKIVRPKLPIQDRVVTDTKLMQQMEKVSSR